MPAKSVSIPSVPLSLLAQLTCLPTLLFQSLLAKHFDLVETVPSFGQAATSLQIWRRINPDLDEDAPKPAPAEEEEEEEAPSKKSSRKSSKKAAKAKATDDLILEALDSLETPEESPSPASSEPLPPAP